MSACEAYSTHTPSGQCDTGDVIQMKECAAYISRPVEKKQQCNKNMHDDPDYIDIQ